MALDHIANSWIRCAPLRSQFRQISVQRRFMTFVSPAALEEEKKRQATHLCGLLLNTVHDGSESRIAEAAGLAGFFIILKPSSHALGAVVERIAKWLVDGVNALTAGHEDLASVLIGDVLLQNFSLTLSKAVEHARGWVATNTGLFVMVADLDGDSSDNVNLSQDWECREQNWPGTVFRPVQCYVLQ